MPDLTQKQSDFARYVVEMGCQADAYRAAYDAENMSDKAIRIEACRLMDNPSVALAVEKLREKHQKRHDITVDKLTQMTIDAYQLAMKESVETPSAAVSAVALLGKLHGLIIDRSKAEHTGADGQPLIPSVNVSISRSKS